MNRRRIFARPLRLHPAQLRPDWTRRDVLGPRELRADVLAGLTNAAVVLPQGIAFAVIAGLPPEYGLYTSMIPAAAAALFGSSMVMVSGATTALSALLFSSLSGLAPLGSEAYVSLVLVSTLMVGIFQFAAGIARLGRLVSFVSHSVLVGFTAVAALLIAISQLSGALGIDMAPGGTVIERLLGLARHIDRVEPRALAVAGVTLAAQVLISRYIRWLPSFIVALGVGAGLAWVLGGASAGIAMIGPISAPLPHFTLPDISFATIALVVPGAAAIATLGLVEAITIGRSFAHRRGETFDANREVVGQALSNLIGGFFQCYASSGSFTRSGVNAEAGARTPLAAILASLFLALFLVAFSRAIVLIPYPAIAGLILYVSWRLIQFDEIRHILRSSRAETTVLGLTAAGGLFVSLEASIYVGVIASFAVFMWQSARPDLVVMAPTTSDSGRRKFRNARLHGLPQCPQLVTIRLDGPLYFGSVDHVSMAFRAVEAQSEHPPAIVLALKGGGSIDLAGADMLIREIRRTRRRGNTFRIVALYPPLIRDLERFGVVAELGQDNLFVSKGDAIAAATRFMRPEICATCKARVFLECGDLPGAHRGAKSGARDVRPAPSQSSPSGCGLSASVRADAGAQ